MLRSFEKNGCPTLYTVHYTVYCIGIKKNMPNTVIQYVIGRASKVKGQSNEMSDLQFFFIYPTYLGH